MFCTLTADSFNDILQTLRKAWADSFFTEPGIHINNYIPLRKYEQTHPVPLINTSNLDYQTSSTSTDANIIEAMYDDDDTNIDTQDCPDLENKNTFRKSRNCVHRTVIILKSGSKL